MSKMSLREKLAQLYSMWLRTDESGQVAPHQHDFAPSSIDWEELVQYGLGQLTRPYGTAPVDPVVGAHHLAQLQRRVVQAGRFGIPAMVHEECLTGLTAWQATIYPSPLCWGASFDPQMVEQMGAQIGATMRKLGVHQGLAPVLDVVRDLRWGRVEETIGEDPFLVGTIGSAYVRGLQSSGVIATLKHFVGYSSSRAGRNFAPVSIGRRELANVMLPPFEMALRDGAGSVMNCYTDIDGVPVAADKSLLSELLRGEYGFTGTVVSDYFAVAFLQTLHGVAPSLGAAAGMALEAGIDIELPNVNAYGEELLGLVGPGGVDPGLVDRAVRRVLAQKCALGLLDPDWSPEPPLARLEAAPLDEPHHRETARELAERSIVLLSNDGVLPLRAGLRVAVVGPLASRPQGHARLLFLPHACGCPAARTTSRRRRAHTVGRLARAIPPDTPSPSPRGAPSWGDTRRISAWPLGWPRGQMFASPCSATAPVCSVRARPEKVATPPTYAFLGARRSCWRRYWPQARRPCSSCSWAAPTTYPRQVDRLSAALCGFFLGEEGATALSNVLSGRTNPSGHLPVSFPPAGGSQPATYLASPLAQRSQVSSVDPTPIFPFGHGLSFAPASWLRLERRSEATWPTDGTASLAVTLRNDAPVPTAEVVQVYLHDPVAEVSRPAQQLIAAQRVELAPGSTQTAVFSLHADLTSYVGAEGRRMVDEGEVVLQVGASSTDIKGSFNFHLEGGRRYPGFQRVDRPGDNRLRRRGLTRPDRPSCPQDPSALGASAPNEALDEAIGVLLHVLVSLVELVHVVDMVSEPGERPKALRTASSGTAGSGPPPT